MDVLIFQYKESQLEEIRIILNDFLSFIANELSKPPWNFNLDEDHEVDLTINNLDKFAEPDGRLLLFEVDGQITGTISLRKIREYSGEIKRMYVRLKFRGKKLGNFMIEEAIRVSKENGFPKLIWWIVRFLFRPPFIVI
jgi:GNAT superfamily N-acetyltransferase